MYYVSDDDLKTYIEEHSYGIKTLNFNHCYWLLPRTIYSAMRMCRNLESLSVIECSIRLSEMLDIILKHLPNLKHLAFSVRSISDIRMEILQPHRNVFKHLKSVAIYFKSRQSSNYNVVLHGEEHSLFDLCDELESIYVGSLLEIKDLCRPIIARPESFHGL